MDHKELKTSNKRKMKKADKNVETHAGSSKRPKADTDVSSTLKKKSNNAKMTALKGQKSSRSLAELRMIYRSKPYQYIQFGQPLEEFDRWIVHNMPSKHYRTSGAHPWIRVRTIGEVEEFGPGSINMKEIMDEFKTLDSREVKPDTIKRLATKYGYTSGKWLFYGDRGDEIDTLWKTVANGVVRGTIPSTSVKVSTVDPKTNNHVICVYNNNFADDSEVYGLRDGIRRVGVRCRLMYKPDIYTSLGIYYSNKWGISATLYTDTCAN